MPIPGLLEIEEAEKAEQEAKVVAEQEAEIVESEKEGDQNDQN